VQIIPDQNSERMNTVGAQLTKLSPKQFIFNCYGMSVTLDVSNLLMRLQQS